MNQIPTEVLPPLYAKWVSELLPAPIRSESLADCANCPMCHNQTETELDIRFEPWSKCCSYIPAVPNFLLGRVLKQSNDHSAETHSTIDSRIRERAGVTPTGFALLASDKTRYQTIITQRRFGRTEQSYRCPYYRESAASCGIHQCRPATCATWFCQHRRGFWGQRFWQAVRRMLLEIENALSRFCLMELGLNVEAITVLGFDKNEPIAKALVADTLDTGLYHHIWGQFAGKEHSFYTSCADLVEQLSGTDVLEIAGARLHFELVAAAETQQQMEQTIFPEKININHHQGVSTPNGNLRIRAYSPYHLFDFPPNIGFGLMQLLHTTQNPVATTALIKKIESNIGHRLMFDHQKALFESGVLTPAHEAPSLATTASL